MTAVVTQEGKHRTDDGLELYTKSWKLAAGSGSDTKARVLFVHGFSDHCNNYGGFFEGLVERGIEVFAFDQRGWGRTVRNRHDRGLTGTTTRVLADITSMLSTLLPSPIPIFLMGHSMGGAEVLHYTAHGPPSLTSQLRGTISSAPLIALHPTTRPNNLTVFAGKLAGKLLPHFQLVQKLEIKWLSRDPVENKKFEDDELCHDTGTLEGLAGMLDRGAALEKGEVLVREGAGEGGKTRLLALHGTADHINEFGATRTYVERLEVADKELKSFDGWYHNLHVEPGNDKYEFAKYVADWILQRSGPLEDARAKL